MRAQMRPRAPNIRLKGAQETPKSAPKLPKNCPRASQTRPRQARKAPKPLQNRARQAPRCVLAATFLGRLVRKAPGAFFCDFSRCALCLRPVFRSTKTAVLLHSQQSESASAHAVQNLEKCGPRGSKTLSGTTRNPPKSSPERAKTWKKPTQRRDKRSKTRKKRSRAKNVPTWCQLGRILASSLETLASPKAFPKNISMR